jgi:hypothetical protein
MTDKTEKELLGMTLEELGFSISSNGMVSNNEMAFDPNDAGITLVPEQPEITHENVCRFYGLNKRFPNVLFQGNEGWTVQDQLHGVYLNHNFKNPYVGGKGFCYSEVKMIDHEWAQLGEVE